MRIKPPGHTVILFTVAVIILCPKQSHSQNAFEAALMTKMDSFFAPVVGVTQNEIYQNDAPSSVMVPSGWGGYGTYVFGGIGGAYPEVYRSNKADLIASVGACTGNPTKAVNVAAGINMANVHKLKDFSANLVISRKIFAGSSISIGGLQLFAKRQQSDAPGSTFYFAFSHAVQTFVSKTTGNSKLSYTIGVGTGRFLYKSPKDITTGKGKYGTAVFGSISYELFSHTNFCAEWTGKNLGLCIGTRPFKNALCFGVGVTNLTSYSADKPNMVFTIGYPLSLNR
jgi:hypothetical protein